LVPLSALRLVDKEIIFYFEAPSTSDALTWTKAINVDFQIASNHS
jgi:hypothetical protein